MIKRIHTYITFLLLALNISAEYLPAVIKIYDESEIEQLMENGVIIERRRDDILLCYFPVDEEDNETALTDNKKKPGLGGSPDRSLLAGDEVSPIKLKNINPAIRRSYLRDRFKLTEPALDLSTTYFNAGEIQEGRAFNTPYTGKGVVAGFCDIGLDPFHPTFMDENGKSRIKQITQYKEYDGERILLRGEEEYAAWVTDNPEKYHATHVGGILAGNGAGTEYAGIAIEADIVVSLSNLTDFGILMGVEDIIEYAKEVGKPAVINISVGSYVGAHDGTSLFCQYLDLCSDDAIIVLSAGNEGNKTNHMSYHIENKDKPLEFRIGNRAWDQKEMRGMTDIWNSSSKPLTLRVCIFDDETHKVVYEYDPIKLTDWEAVTYIWDPSTPEIDGLSLDGYLTVIAGVDPENDRYEIGLIYEYKSTRLIGSGWAKDLLSFKLEGPEGDVIEIFSDGTYTRLMEVSGSPLPDSKCSISDLACGFKTISVGMYGNRSDYPVTKFDSNGTPAGELIKPSGYAPLQTVIHSSYGTLNDGRILPLTVAPGMPLISAMSKPFIENSSDEEYLIKDNGTIWHSEGGTSMSSPYVAGYIATWLEAIPDLDSSDIIRMISESNNLEIADLTDPRNSNGYFNPIEGLRREFNKNGIKLPKDPLKLLQPTDRIVIYDLRGMKIFSGKVSDFQDNPPGIFIIQTPYGTIKSSVGCMKELQKITI